MFDARKNKADDVSMGRRIPKPEAAPEVKTESVSTVKAGKSNRRWFALGVLILTGSVVTGIRLTQGAEIRAVDVSGVSLTPEQTILKTARIPTGVPLDSVGFRAAITRVERLPYVKRASVHTKANGTVRIMVEERIPTARLITENGHFLVDSDGVVMPVPPGKALDAPELRGFRATYGDTLTSTLFRAAMDFLAALPNHDLARLTLTGIAAEPGTGITAVTVERRVRVVFGHDHFDERLRHWNAFYAQIIPVKGIQRFRHIDLRYRGQLITQETNR